MLSQPGDCGEGVPSPVRDTSTLAFVSWSISEGSNELRKLEFSETVCVDRHTGSLYAGQERRKEGLWKAVNFQLQNKYPTW